MNNPITFIVDDLTGRGGTERILVEIANFLVKSGFNISIVSIYQHNEKIHYDLDAQVRTHFILKFRKKYFLDYPVIWLKLNRLISAQQNSIFIATDINRLVQLLPVLPKIRSRLIAWEHFCLSHALSKTRARFARWLAVKYTNKIVVLSQSDKKDYIDYYSRPEKIIHIPNPTPSIQTTLSPYVKQNVVLCVGRLEHQKGIDTLLRIWQKITRKHTDWQLWIVGSGSLEAQLKQQANTLNIQNSTQFFPNSNDIAYYYQSASIYALPSRFEGYVLVLLEAKSFGLPAVAFDCKHGPKEIISEGQDGYVVNDQDETAFTYALEKLIESKDLRENFAHNAVTNSQKFSIDSIGQLWLNLLKNMA